MQKQIYILFIIFLFVSCEKDVDLDLKEIPPTPVLEGFISTDYKNSYFKITMTKGFKRDTYEYEAISNAKIKVFDNQGDIINFYYDKNHEAYKTTKNAMPDKNYHFEAVFDKYKITANEPLLSLPIILDAHIVRISDEYGYKKVSLEISIKDTSELIDYYYIELKASINNEPAYTYMSFFANDYEKTNSKYKVDDIYLQETENLYIAVHHITENYYNYIMTLYEIGSTDYGQTPFNTTVLGNPKSNLNTGIGFFGTSSISYFKVHK